MASTLRKGSSGSEVKQLQTILTNNGYNTKGIDGAFGNNTLSALQSYQSANGLTADGVAGNLTWAKLNSAGQTAAPSVPAPTTPVASAAPSAPPPILASVPQQTPNYYGMDINTAPPTPPPVPAIVPQQVPNYYGIDINTTVPQQVPNYYGVDPNAVAPAWDASKDAAFQKYMGAGNASIMQEMGNRGIVNSTTTTTQLAQLLGGASPEYENMALAKWQNEQTRKMNVASFMSGQDQQAFVNNQNAQAGRLNTANFLSGQDQQAYANNQNAASNLADQKQQAYVNQQNAASFMSGQDQQAYVNQQNAQSTAQTNVNNLYSQLATMDEEGYATYKTQLAGTQEQRNKDIQSVQTFYNEKSTELEKAIASLYSLGYADNDAALTLGIAVGTTTAQATQAITGKQKELQTLESQMNYKISSNQQQTMVENQATQLRNAYYNPRAILTMPTPGGGSGAGGGGGTSTTGTIANLPYGIIQSINKYGASSPIALSYVQTVTDYALSVKNDPNAQGLVDGFIARLLKNPPSSSETMPQNSTPPPNIPFTPTKIPYTPTTVKYKTTGPTTAPNTSGQYTQPKPTTTKTTKTKGPTTAPSASGRW